VLYGRSNKLHASPAGTVWLRNNELDIMPGMQQGLQRWYSELRRTAKDEAHGLPLAVFLHFANLAQKQIALQRAYAKDEEDSIEMIDLMLKGSRQQFVSIHFKPLSLNILSADAHLFGSRHPFTNLRQAQAALLLILLALFVNNLGIDENNLFFRIFLEAQVDNGQPFGDADLGCSQPDALRRIHRLEHVVDQGTQFIIELAHRLGWLLQNRIGIFNDLSNHSSKTQ
jgi:hypothetical protein